MALARPPSSRRRALLPLLVALALLPGGCGDDGPSGPRPPLGIGEGEIGPAGGRVETDDENAAVVVPAGALDAPTVLRIRKLPVDSLPAPLLARQRVSDTYRFGPEGIAFRAPVEVQIFFDADLLPPGVTLENLTIGRVNAAGELEELSKIRILPVGDRVALQATKRGVGGQISSFSPFAVWVDDPEVAEARGAASGRRGAGRAQPGR